ncbi:hypothetical protein [Mariniflexile sp. AS56]|uniref:hypothetical protein n=1 Tax=Mariniflexile sp. AS56 TaxID=3063957 RepID=UPI0026EBC261|nr:hypothetical protein [Mariniflexile sp. AS56]MDO7174202.1 hypothetical protein [Mariniflexile sp. AS56]
MSKLKSEIEQYLLENDFSLVDDVISSDTTFVYTHNKTKTHHVHLFKEPNENFAMVDLENNYGKKKYCFAERFIITSLKEFVFLITHSTRSFLCNEKLLR